MVVYGAIAQVSIGGLFLAGIIPGILVGLFLMATIKKYGEGTWQSYWYKLAPNGVRIVADWTTAWTVEYAGGGNPGTYPLVVSYASSPPAEIVYAADPKNPPAEPDSGIITDTCFRQTEYVGVLRGAKNPNNARARRRYGCFFRT